MHSIFLLLSVFSVFSAVLAFDATKYSKTQELSPLFTIYWTIEGEELHLALRAQTTGWLGFGIGELASGSMPGADIITGFVANDKAEITDRYATGYFEPLVDECQDWRLVSGEETEDETILEVQRKLNTGDEAQDHTLDAGLVHVIWAFGETDVFSYHTQREHTTVVFSGTVQLYDKEQLDDPSFSTFDFKVKNYLIPTQTTTYTELQLQVPKAIGTVHLVGFQVLIPKESAPFVHHFVLYGNYAGGVRSTVWAWAPGTDVFVLPKDLGFLAGKAPDGIKSFSMSVHYNNPQRISGIRDNSIVRIYYTSILRPLEAGILQVGDPWVTEPKVIPKGSGESEYSYDCPSQCTSEWKQPIHMLGSALHMHQVGTMAWSSLWRDGERVAEIGRVEYYSFELQSFVPLNMTAYPGDRITMNCVYKQTPSHAVKFGQASTDEMCINFILYYPRMKGDGYCGFVYAKEQKMNATRCNDKFLPIPNPSQPDDGEERVKIFGVPQNSDFKCPEAEGTEEGTKTEEATNSGSASSSTTTLDFFSLWSFFAISVLFLFRF